MFERYLELSYLFSWEDGHSFLIGHPMVLLRSEQQISPFNRSQFKQLANRDPFGATSNNDIIIKIVNLRSSLNKKYWALSLRIQGFTFKVVLQVTHTTEMIWMIGSSMIKAIVRRHVSTFSFPRFCCSPYNAFRRVSFWIMKSEN